MLLLGSHALEMNIGRNNLGRKPMDYDFICTFDEFNSWAKNRKLDFCYPIQEGKKMVAKEEGNIYEFELAWEGSTAEELVKIITNEIPKHERHYSSGFMPNGWNAWFINYANLDTLYTLKMSHRYLKNNPHFLKTMKDIHLMREHGASIPGYLKDWYKKRQKATYTYKHPNLKQNKMGFFNPNEGVLYVYDHDSIHVAMAHLERPAYEYYKGDTAEVFCDKKKFFGADENVRLYGVLEEAYVLALERSQVPFKNMAPKTSFLIALEKVCTSITSGWFREYAWENYNKVLALYDPNYVKKFWNAVDKGIVKQYKKVEA